MLHHVAGEHEWAEGKCNHGPLVDTEMDKIFLDKNSKALEAIRKIVTDPKFLKALDQYVTFWLTFHECIKLCYIVSIEVID